MEELSLTEIQDISTEILKKVADICETQGLTYFLAYGTLIGAVRHNAPIPWDDDIDIMMPRKDYDNLLQYFENNPDIVYPLKMMNSDTIKSYPYMISRVSDMRYFLKVQNEKPYGLGVFIDIYPLDGLGNDKETAKKLIDKTKNLSSLIFLSTRRYFHRGNTKSILKCIIKFPTFIYAKVLGKNHFAKKIYRLNSKYSYDNSKYIGCLLWPTYRFREVLEKQLFAETILADYGKYKFKIPKEFDKILTHIYGDYMKLPPETDRIPHHLYKAYRRKMNEDKCYNTGSR